MAGQDIPLGAQIVGIVDVYSALTNDRPFRKAKSHEEAVDHLRDRARRGMSNPELVEKFIACLEQAVEPCDDSEGTNGQD